MLLAADRPPADVVRVQGLSPPPSHSDPAAPNLQVELLSPQRRRLGQGVTYRLRYRNLPWTLLTVRVARDVAETERPADFHGRVGAIALARPILGDGRTDEQWDGLHLTCFPRDIGPLCEGIEPGRYRIVAEVWAVPAVPRRQRDPQPAPLLTAYSSPFRLVGAPDRRDLLREMESRATQYVEEALDSDRGGRLSSFFAPTRLFLTRAGLCARFRARPPVTGVITACLPAAAMTDAGLRWASGDILVSGLVTNHRTGLSREQAETLAFATADRLYNSRVPYPAVPGMKRHGLRYVRLRPGEAPPNPTPPQWNGRPTYLQNGLDGWDYYPEAGYWAFEIYELEAGGPESLTGRFAERLLVRVEDNGRACIVQRLPYNRNEIMFAVAARPCPHE